MAVALMLLLPLGQSEGARPLAEAHLLTVAELLELKLGLPKPEGDPLSQEESEGLAVGLVLPLAQALTQKLPETLALPVLLTELHCRELLPEAELHPLLERDEEAEAEEDRVPPAPPALLVELTDRRALAVLHGLIRELLLAAPLKLALPLLLPPPP